MNKLKKDYENDGFVLIKHFFSKDEIELIKADVRDYIDKGLSKRKNKRAFHLTKNKIVNSIHGLDNLKSVKALQNSKKVKNLIKLLLGSKVDNFGSELFAKPAKEGLPVPLHQDNKYWCLDDGKGLTMWIALEKSGKKNGAIFYYTSSHKLGLLEHEPSFAPGSSQKIKYEDGLNIFKKHTPLLNTGDCLIHHCLVVHGSHENISNKSRTGLTLRFKNRKTKIDLFQKKIYESQLKKQLNGK